MDKPRKRANGQGTISLKDGVWVARYFVTLPSGKRKRKSFHARTEDEAIYRLEKSLSGWTEEDLSSDDGGEHVYFIQGANGGPIKIGTTNNVENRLRILQGASPVRLRVIHTIPGGSYKVEKKLHQRFAPFRLWGEWFDASRELLQYIHRLKEEVRTERKSPTAHQRTPIQRQMGRNDNMG